MFEDEAERFRPELVAHCYRLLGSIQDAEDMVQETYVRAWRSYDRFEGRSSLRSWLYRIATNRCLTELAGRGRRALPSDLSEPATDPDSALDVAPETPWLEPIPDPATVAEARDGLRLALVAALQHLPPRQRAVLLLRDVLALPAADVADMLGTSTASVKSALQRARAHLGDLALVDTEISAPQAPGARALLDRYIAAFENSDIEALEHLLVADVTLEATPSRTWFAGRRTCLPFLRDHLLGPAGTWRMRPTRANGQPAAAAWVRDANGTFQPYGICVLTVTGAGIARITSFGDPGLLEVFGFPPDSSVAPAGS